MQPDSAVFSPIDHVSHAGVRIEGSRLNNKQIIEYDSKYWVNVRLPSFHPLNIPTVDGRDVVVHTEYVTVVKEWLPHHSSLHHHSWHDSLCIS